MTFVVVGGAVDLDSSSLSPLMFSSRSRIDLMNKNISGEKRELMLTSVAQLRGSGPAGPSWPAPGSTLPFLIQLFVVKVFTRDKSCRGPGNHWMLLIFQMTKADVGMTKAEVI